MSLIQNHRAIVILTVLLATGGGLFLVERYSPKPDLRPPVEESTPASYRHATVQFDAFGDSITWGDPLYFDVMQDGSLRRSANSYQGWPELLGSMLTEHSGKETAVWNMGYPGDKANKSLRQRLPTLLKAHEVADTALLLMGTNDSNDFEPTPAGEACVGDACLGTYKGEVITVLEELRAAGRSTIYMSTIPPAWGPTVDEIYPDPLDPEVAMRNKRIRQYNRIIHNEFTTTHGVKLGPDLFSCFLSEDTNRFSLFEDSLHPNELGYTYIAALWFKRLTSHHHGAAEDSCTTPVFLLDELDSYAFGHKQNLRVAGDSYYTDEDFRLVNIPDELESGVWVLQANADRNNAAPEVMQFEIGPQPADVFIGYDVRGKPPVSLTHTFAPATLSSQLSTTDNAVGTFALVAATGVTGAVSLGGSASASADADAQAYVVVVVPQQ